MDTLPPPQDTDGRDEIEPINATPAYKLVAAALERLIVSGKVKPGEAIGTEAELVKKFGVNRSTVREGIRLLEQGGLIRRDSSRRLYASVPRYDRLACRISRAFVLHEVSFRELWESMTAIETAVVELAAERITPDLLGELDLNLKKTARMIDSPADLAQLDVEFHAIVSKAAGNRVLQLAREPSNLLLHPSDEMLFKISPIAAQRNLKAHAALLDALHKHDKAEAVLWMRRHLNDWKKAFELLGKSLDEPIDRICADHILEMQ
ncbi:FadR/GntR family transcriptional regulator [Azospirillum griseum]|uniref:FadR family transcriptional regulator n=1 Tax=Azospirillum griseum TaxID=2496639 RepID=A0A431VA22_9PROT|nr:FCD domain-containing protein [Azospirillum griseum]RTR13030.1 FadR family transcriptional regulator [Azospirillum griseum]